jgi:3',5'-cyclic AMP phosphodiesterase CpdA
MRRARHRHRLALSVCLLSAWLLAAAAAPVAPARQAATPAPLPLTLPNTPDSLKFGVMGDFGTGRREQYELAEVMARVRAQFPFTLMLTVGDNLYGGNGPRDFLNKFEKPYKALLDGGVKFYASLGNHDSRQQSNYEPFNMGGRTYYTFKAPKESVRFFALETSYLDPQQLQWLERELDSSGEDWKIPYFHHPLYSSGGRHGSDLPKRRVLEPLFVKYGVSVVFAGHDHVYERVKPQQGIVHFVVGSSGQLRRGNLDKTGFTDVANAREQAFLVAEIDGDEMHFNAVSRSGQVIDSGVIARRRPE